MILYFDSSDGAAIRVWLEGGRTPIAFQKKVRSLRGANILAAIERFMAANHVVKKKIGGVVASKGPGSYTGVRVGAAVAKGLAMGLGVKASFLSRQTMDRRWQKASA